MNKLIAARVLYFFGLAILFLFPDSELFMPFGFFAFFALVASGNYLEKEHLQLQQTSKKEYVVAAALFVVLWRLDSRLEKDVLTMISEDGMSLAVLAIGYVAYCIVDLQQQKSEEPAGVAP